MWQVRCEGGAESHMADLSFGRLQLVDSFPVTMSGAALAVINLQRLTVNPQPRSAKLGRVSHRNCVHVWWAALPLTA